ncbi:hypothetical protein MKZ38_005130 [Zalerion maritima]|uniref:Metal homeostatis protein bsd2 n=1 Tax=Zalerion maritima TaxID=339359 RepID=A0AAD5WPG3_9PEZI|nr:hypothetical protein MKZ38_005130 [Zalerion maritima]
MAGRYERVNPHDEDDTPTSTPIAPRSGYTIPNSPPPSFRSRTSSLAQREARRPVDPALEDAFDGDDSDGEADDRQRLVRSNTSSTFTQRGQEVTSRATPAAVPSPATNAAQTSTAGRVYGGGIQSDGVFSNLTAKPERGDSEKDEQPPTYEQAAADSAPPYWETTILAPGLGGPDEVYIDGLPVGSLFSFVWNGMISTSFQLVGFLLTYLLHTTHAAKNGSRAGLGITLIQYGFYMKDSPTTVGGSHGEGYANPPDPNSHDFNPNEVKNDDGGSGGDWDIAGSQWVAYILMVVGWFILIRSVSDYIKAKKHEKLVLQSPDRGLGVPVIAEGESPERVV